MARIAIGTFDAWLELHCDISVSHDAGDSVRKGVTGGFLKSRVEAGCWQATRKTGKDRCWISKREHRASRAIVKAKVLERMDEPLHGSASVSE